MGAKHLAAEDKRDSMGLPHAQQVSRKAVERCERAATADKKALAKVLAEEKEEALRVSELGREESAALLSQLSSQLETQGVGVRALEERLLDERGLVGQARLRAAAAEAEVAALGEARRQVCCLGVRASDSPRA